MQAIAADLRQADDLLSARHIDAGWVARCPDYFHPEGCADAEGLSRRWIRFGIRIEYAAQPKPEGIAQAFLIGAVLPGDSGASLILGDNIFYGKLDFYREALALERGACIFGYQVRDPERYGGGGIGFGWSRYQPRRKTETSQEPVRHSRICTFTTIASLSFAGNSSRRRAGSWRLPISIWTYLERKELHVKLLGRGMAWLDTGTQTSLLEAGNYIATIEHRQGLKIACLEEVAFRMNFITEAELKRIIDRLPKGEYQEYLRLVCAEGHAACSPEPTA